MKYYTFYSDYNDLYKASIPREIRDKVEYEYIPIPEKYRDPRFDIFITDIDEVLPDDWKYFKSLQIWYSGKNNMWKYDLWWSNDIDDIKLIKEKYMDTFKEVPFIPSYAPTDILHTFLKCVFLEYYDDMKDLFEKNNVHFNSEPPRWRQ